MNIVLPVVASIFFLFVIFAALSSSKKIRELRNQGVYPKEGEASDADVLRLLQQRQKILAIRCYREVHKVGLKEAKEAVEDLERRHA